MVQNYLHSGDIGDLIYCLPAIKHNGKGNLYLNLSPNISARLFHGFNNNKVKSIVTLLKEQPYIGQVKVWHGETIDINLDIFRDSKTRENITYAALDALNIPRDTANDPWLCAVPNRVASVVFHRSFLYRNSRANLKRELNKYKDSIFVGAPKEWKNFCEEVGYIKYHKTENLCALACVIAASDLFIGNQSAPMAIAIGLGKNFLQEVCAKVPNCIFKVRENGFYLPKNSNLKLL